MMRLPILLATCLAALGAALPVDRAAALLQRDDEVVAGDDDDDVSGFDFSMQDFMEADEEDKPHKKHRVTPSKRERLEAMTAAIDQAIPLLEKDFKVKTQQLKIALASFKSKQMDMDIGKREATQAMKALRQEAERRRRAASDRRKAKEMERKSKEEAVRTAKDAMIKKAKALMGVKGQEADGILGDLSLSVMVDVLMALPEAVENPLFIKRLTKSKDLVVNSVQDFLNITRRKTAKFVLAASKASDVELSFLLARYFHEASFRVKSIQSDSQKIARDLNVVMPVKLRRSFNPIIKGLRANAVPLRVNASSLASATITDACKEMSSLMGNISDYNNKLNSMHGNLHSVWQLSELMLPKVGKIYPMKAIVIDTVKDVMAMATNEVAGLAEAADEIVTNVGPIIAERMQCTWSSALPRSSAGWAALLAALAGYLLA